jgi:hypothetical protein
MFKWFKEFFFGSTEPVKPAEAPAPTPAPKKAETKAEPKLTKASLSKLTKGQLEAKGREFGIELDKRKKKDDLVAEVFKASKSK